LTLKLGHDLAALQRVEGREFFIDAPVAVV